MTMKTSRRTAGIWQAVALILAALYAVPVGYIVMISLTPSGQNLGQWPTHLDLGNYADAFGSTDFVRFFGNSVAVAVVCTLTQLLLSCSAGYALALLPVRAKNTLTLLVVALLVVPPEVAMVPLFVMITRVPLLGGNDILGAGGTGMLDTLPALMLPHLVSALPIFLMRQFYAGLPTELGDAARVDGASEVHIFARIYTPLVKPAAAIVAVIAFQAAWNDFLWPLVSTTSNDMRTLQLGLTIFFQENSTQWTLLMAAVLAISIPIVIGFLLVQRFFRSGVLSGALK
ncbi:carbohydrate ABC transporter permease [Ruania alba]|uniref:Multiple sugar transport system permease protein n=1 Tax=Ruania alba TaxID=648782 RepID=A0A1H5EKJ7_9MICO|nr:carbohydrate ABC transporter permease [Ruania alba]SED91687.1 multiple sugar transport system permease protein [Ruania alba]